MANVTLHYNFTENPSLAGNVDQVDTTPTLSITRATTGMMKDADGWLREVQSGEARFPGASFSHNLMKNSGELDGANWTEVNVTITADQANDVNGEANMDLITATANNGKIQQNITTL